MTVDQIHTNLRIVLDKVAQNSQYAFSPAFTAAEESVFLNIALNQVVKEKLTKLLLLEMQDLYNELYGRLTIDLSGIIVHNNVPNTNFTNRVTNTFTAPFALAGGIEYVLNAYLVGYETQFNRKITAVTETLFLNYVLTSDNYPYVPKPVYTIQMQQHLRVAIDPTWQWDGASIDIKGIRTPAAIVDSGTNEYGDLPDRVMYEVIDKAAALMLESTESQRTATKPLFNVLDETR